VSGNEIKALLKTGMSSKIYFTQDFLTIQDPKKTKFKNISRFGFTTQQ
jgi:hypothetical protein